MEKRRARWRATRVVRRVDMETLSPVHKHSQATSYLCLDDLQRGRRTAVLIPPRIHTSNAYFNSIFENTKRLSQS
jgi:hypothetical protein